MILGFEHALSGRGRGSLPVPDGIMQPHQNVYSKAVLIFLTPNFSGLQKVYFFFFHSFFFRVSFYNMANCSRSLAP